MRKEFLCGKIRLLGKLGVLLPGFVKNTFRILMYPFVHSGSSFVFFCPETKIPSFRRGLLNYRGLSALLSRKVSIVD